MFQNTCDLLNIDTDANKVLDFPQDILTPGDFNVIKRQHRFLKLKTAEDVMSRLNDEVKHKSKLTLKPDRKVDFVMLPKNLPLFESFRGQILSKNILR